MPLHTIPLLHNLQGLQHQLAVTPGYGRALQAALDRDRGAVGALPETLAAESHMRSLALTAARIAAQIAPADDLGPAPGSLSELVLRAARLVLLVELDALCAVVRERAWRAPFPMPPYTMDHLTGPLRAELQRATATWRAPGERQCGDRSAYRVGLREAHGVMRRLDDSPAGYQLREGTARLDWPEVQDVCVRMVAVLQLRIDVDPDSPILVRRRRTIERAARRSS